MKSVLRCDSVSKSFPHKSGTVDALKGVSLEVASAEFIAVNGKSGSGKSTLSLTAGGLQRPDSGEVTVNGQSLYAMTADERASFRADHIGFVFQQFHLIPYLDVVENVMTAKLGATSAASSQDRSSALELIDRVGLSDRRAHKPSALSTGECQRVALARALLNQPSLIIADEPTGNLDEENTDIVLQSLREIADSGTAVLLVTHDAQCTSYVDRVVRMADGELVKHSPVG